MVSIVNIVLVLLSIAAIVFLIIRTGRHSKKQEEIKRRFLEEEEAANSVRKKEIEPELFYVADLDALPPIPDNDPHQVRRCAARQMIRFETPMTNLELKKLYGPQQIDTIAQHEENFSEYLKSLTKWAVSIADDHPEDALTIFGTVIELGGEFRDAYKMAADIFASRNDSEGLQNLQAAAKRNHFKDPHIKQQILEHIEAKIA